MAKLIDHADNKFYVWQLENGSRFTAVRSYTHSGVYWNIDIKAPGKRLKKLGTRCTWYKVLDFINDYDNR